MSDTDVNPFDGLKADMRDAVAAAMRQVHADSEWCMPPPYQRMAEAAIAALSLSEDVKCVVVASGAFMFPPKIRLVSPYVQT